MILNRILFWILIKIYRVNPSFCNPVNWRVAHPAEPISKVLEYCPLIFKGFTGQMQYGFENLVVLANGFVYLIPNRVEMAYPSAATLTKGTSEYELAIKRGEYNLQMRSLVKFYMETEPNILVKRFPAKLLRKLIKRVIPYSKQLVENRIAEDQMTRCMTVSQAIQSDLKNPINSTPQLAKKAFPKDEDI